MQSKEGSGLEGLMKKIFYKLIVIMILFVSTSYVVNAQEVQIESPYVYDENIENTINKYTVLFIDEVRNTEQKVEVEHGKTVKEILVDNELIENKENQFLKFIYWSKKEHENYIRFNFDTKITQNIILYAEYAVVLKPDEKIEKEIMIKFDSQGGSKIDNISTSGEEDFLVKKPKTPSRKGYKFLGWYTESKGGKKWDFKNDYAESHMTLYAHWQYIDTFNSGAGKNLTSPKTGYNVQFVFGGFILGILFLGMSCVKLKKNK